MVPFRVRFEKPDKGLFEELRSELPGILAWAVRGCIDWQHRGGLDAPDEVLAARKTYREESDTVLQWIDACCIVGEDMRATGGSLWSSYRTWAEAAAIKNTVNQTVFGYRLTTMFQKERKGVVTYTGIGLAYSQDGNS